MKSKTTPFQIKSKQFSGKKKYIRKLGYIKVLTNCLLPINERKELTNLTTRSLYSYKISRSKQASFRKQCQHYNIKRSIAKAKAIEGSLYRVNGIWTLTPPPHRLKERVKKRIVVLFPDGSTKMLTLIPILPHQLKEHVKDRVKKMVVLLPDNTMKEYKPSDDQQKDP